MRRWIGRGLMWAALGLGAALGGAGAALAQDVDCDNPQTQVEITVCAQYMYDAADAALNTSYQQAMAVMQEADATLPAQYTGAAKALKDAQRVWITYRDAACKAEGFLMQGGTGQSAVILFCLARLTEQRTNDLDLIASAMEG